VILVVMGPSGSGKTAVGGALAARLGCAFVDADDLHTPEARAKMARSEPLTDSDRIPWLERVREAARAAGPDVVVACSALRRAYRDVLRSAWPDVRFVALDAPEAVLCERVRLRNSTTGHFMPESLVADQVRTWEPPGDDEPDSVRIASTDSIAALVQRIMEGSGRAGGTVPTGEHP
jgi:carbohydrate kinase (thermoresistant glucokinase family)